MNQINWTDIILSATIVLVSLYLPYAILTGVV